MTITIVGAASIAYTVKNNNDTKKEETSKVANVDPTPTPSPEPTIAPTPTIEILPTSTPAPTATTAPIATAVPTLAPTKKPNPTAAPTAVPSLYSTHTSKAFGISFSYPKGYTVSEVNNECTKTITVNGATKIVINFDFIPGDRCADGSGSYCNNSQSTTASVKLSNGQTVTRTNNSCSDPLSYGVFYNGNFSGVSGTYKVEYITSSASSGSESRADIIVQTIKKL